MPAPKKDAAKASAPTPTAPAETPGAPTPAQPVDAPSAPADTVLTPPPAVAEPEEHDDALAKLANEADDDAPEVSAPALVPAPDAPVLASSPGPTNPAMSEVDILREQIERMRQQHEAEMNQASERIASLLHKPPAAPVPARDPLREAKNFGVLATWKGPGMYGGPYYTIAGVRMPTAMGITTGYFPAADLERHADLFTRVK